MNQDILGATWIGWNYRTKPAASMEKSGILPGGDVRGYQLCALVSFGAFQWEFSYLYTPHRNYHHLLLAAQKRSLGEADVNNPTQA